MTHIDKNFQQSCQQIVEDQGLSLYDFEYLPNSSLVRIYVLDEKTNTAVIEDCIKIDIALSSLFEESEDLPENIVLEVSSPGVFRHLNGLDHFKKVIGQRIKIILYKKRLQNDKEVRQFIAPLVSVDNEGIILSVEGDELFFNFDLIKKANLEPEIK